MKPFYRSKKWWTAAIAALIPILNHLLDLDLDATELATVIIPLIAYVLGESVADAAGAARATNRNNNLEG